MGGFKGNFKRYEKKFLLSRDEYIKIIAALESEMVPDRYGESTICNIYFDTPNMRLIRKSIEKPVYKEKLRLRCYNVPDDETVSFVEIKKKCKGIVYKRRISLPYARAYDFLVNKTDEQFDSQIGKEIAWFISYYRELQPAVVLTYDRQAFFHKSISDLRITFDTNITWRTQELDLRKGVFGNKLLNDGEYLMEIKIPVAIPLWLVKILEDLKIYPISYSKYGNVYKFLLNKYIQNKGV